MGNVVDADDGVEQQPGHDDRGEGPAEVVGPHILEDVQEHQDPAGDAHHPTFREDTQHLPPCSALNCGGCQMAGSPGARLGPAQGNL